MTEVTLTQDQVAFILKSIKLTKADPAAKTTISFNKTTKNGIFRTTGTAIEVESKLDLSSNKDIEDLSVTLMTSKLVVALEIYSHCQKIKVSCSNKELKFQDKKRITKITELLPVISEEKRSYIDIATWDIHTIVNLAKASTPITKTNNTITVIKNEFVMTVDSNNKESISLTNLNTNKFPPKLDISKTISKQAEFGVMTKDIELAAKALVAANVFTGEVDLKIKGLIAADQIAAFTFVLGKTNNSLNITVRLVADNIFAKELSILDKCSKYTTQHYFECDAMALKEAAENAALSETTQELKLFNSKEEPTVLKISTLQGSYSDELTITSDCVFDITIRNIHFSAIINNIGLGKVKICLSKTQPIMVARGSGISITDMVIYFISCYNAPALKMPYTVNELNETRNKVVASTTKSEKTGSVPELSGGLGKSKT